MDCDDWDGTQFSYLDTGPGQLRGYHRVLINDQWELWDENLLKPDSNTGFLSDWHSHSQCDFQMRIFGYTYVCIGILLLVDRHAAITDVNTSTNKISK